MKIIVYLYFIYQLVRDIKLLRIVRSFNEYELNRNKKLRKHDRINLSKNRIKFVLLKFNKLIDNSRK